VLFIQTQQGTGWGVERSGRALAKGGVVVVAGGNGAALISGTPEGSHNLGIKGEYVEHVGGGGREADTICWGLGVGNLAGGGGGGLTDLQSKQPGET